MYISYSYIKFSFVIKRKVPCNAALLCQSIVRICDNILKDKNMPNVHIFRATLRSTARYAYHAYLSENSASTYIRVLSLTPWHYVTTGNLHEPPPLVPVAEIFQLTMPCHALRAGFPQSGTMKSAT